MTGTPPTHDKVPMRAVEAEVQGELFRFYPERAVYWPRPKILFVSDLHLGKAETFQKNGLWLPMEAQVEDLLRLNRLIDQLHPSRLLILGDLIHTKIGITQELEARFADWLNQAAVEIDLLVGNHDRHFAKKWPSAWGRVQLAQQISIDGFRFQHEPDNDANAPDTSAKLFTWMGHLHPVIRIQSGAERLRLPCFYLREDSAYLPAFSSLAGGENIRPAQRERVIATSLEDNWAGLI